MAEYDRNFYSRKGNNFLKFFLIVAVIGLLCYGGNMISTTFYNISIWDALDNFIESIG
ncbi:MAG: hypothetical protein MJ245_01965 [Clostridia bacterium]|nr:hypothetical protein [Clostridia bacterium]